MSSLNFNGALFRKLRIQKGCKSLRDLSLELYKTMKVNISEQSIQHHESGKHTPRFDTIIYYAKFLGVDPEQLWNKKS